MSLRVLLLRESDDSQRQPHSIIQHRQNAIILVNPVRSPTHSEAAPIDRVLPPWQVANLSVAASAAARFFLIPGLRRASIYWVTLQPVIGPAVSREQPAEPTAAEQHHHRERDEQACVEVHLFLRIGDVIEWMLSCGPAATVGRRSAV